ncbi:hypothetical protein GCM10010124_39910 [Pilimelia terevasa]|uniref:Uncharacterized protein n=1 Tax=Pilimelia terevasa TaxID=53372 RepID=A0A8J3FK69_9ACTN|nr:hypothetical protein [Pilimelia terevasa]GGK43092.1 hypothetical protein GCM10010124_39910 [Pilimelia terevasa]
MRFKQIWSTWGTVVVGLFLVVLGIMAALSPAPRCEGVPMTPGQTCVDRGRFGAERVNTYDEKIRTNRIVQWAAPAAGVVLLIFGGLRVARSRTAAAPD